MASVSTDCVAYGAVDGAVRQLVTGDVVDGEDAASVYVQNGIAKYTFGETGGGPTGYLYRWHGGQYVRALTNDGDWAYFVTNSGNTGWPDRVNVVKATTDEVKLAFEWDAWNVGSVNYRDWVGAGGINYPQSSGTPKTITSIRLVKIVIMRRGREGVYLNWFSDPRVGPFARQLPAYNNDTSYGEREFGTGGGNHTTWSSGGVTIKSLEFSAAANWDGTAYTNNLHAGLAIDDADYPPYSSPDHVERQHANYPAEQEEGPFWAADLHNDPATYPFIRYVITRTGLEVSVFHFSFGSLGATVVHFANNFHDLANMPYESMVFIGATPYKSADLAAEPTATAQALMLSRATVDFEECGKAGAVVDATAADRALIEERLKDLSLEQTAMIKRALSLQ